MARHLVSATRAFSLFATHYFELTQLAATTPAAVNLHLAAAEHQGGIVFLHEVRPGPASRSYGLQVARLAGLPVPVVRKAGLLLEQLETRARAQDDQLDLFAQTSEYAGGEGESDAALASLEPPQAHHAAGASLVAALRAIDPDALNPRQALDALYALHALLNDEGHR